MTVSVVANGHEDDEAPQRTEREAAALLGIQDAPVFAAFAAIRPQSDARPGPYRIAPRPRKRMDGAL
jgi:hypothetical protein